MNFNFNDFKSENIEKALSTLTERECLVCKWHYLDRHVISDIARVLGKTSSMVYVIKKRAIHKLQKPWRMAILRGIIDAEQNE